MFGCGWWLGGGVCVILGVFYLVLGGGWVFGCLWAVWFVCG